MFCRVEILAGDAKRVICTHYRTGKDQVEIEQFAERVRIERGADGFRLFNLYTGETSETGRDD
jgi:heme-degrading monooxygenase HmoA